MNFDVAILFQRMEVVKGQYGYLVPADVVIGKKVGDSIYEYLKDPVPSIVGKLDGNDFLYEAGIGFPISNRELTISFISDEEITEDNLKFFIDNYKLNVMNANAFIYQYEDGELHIYRINVMENVIQEVDISKSFYQNLLDLEQEMNGKIMRLEDPFTGDDDE